MKLKKIRWKNFFSYGKGYTEIDLDQKKIVGIFGKNGSGKSILLDALNFVTTGKAFRNKIKKNQIINSRNKKNCVVELYLSKGKDNFIIKRGMKPDIFEIIKNDKSLDESAHIKDFQTILEQIFSFDPKVLKNTLFMSSMDYSPFLLFTLSEKREFVENILNLSIFGNLLNNLKIDLSVLKKEIQEIGFKFQMIEKEIKTINEMNDLIKEKQNSNKSDIYLQIKKIEKDIIKKTTNLHEIEEKLVNDQKFYDKNNNKYQAGITEKDADLFSISSKISLLESKIKREQGDIVKENTLKNFFEENSNCNTCKQKIDENHKRQIVCDIDKRTIIIEEKINKINDDIDKLKINVKKIDNTKQKIIIFGNKNKKYYEENIPPSKNEIQKLKTDVFSSENIIKNHKKTLGEMESSDILKDVTKNEEKGKEVKNKLIDKEGKEKIILLSKNLLSDKGIKLFIINKYIPLLNKYVNNFLDLMNAPYRLKFDNELHERIILRGYENLSYHSFSSGEQQRCDLALLFAFLKISKIKNSFDCNVLVLDEIIGNSLDSEGITGVMNILHAFKREGMTIFIISHMDSIKNMLDEVYCCEKKIFSEIKT